MSVTRLPLSATRARELLVAAIEDRGENFTIATFGGTCAYLQYEDGVYQTSPFAPSCIIGHALVSDGVEMHNLARHESSPAIDVVAHFYPKTDTSVLEALNQAQYVQDVRGTWGEALAAFDSTLAEYEMPVAA